MEVIEARDDQWRGLVGGFDRTAPAAVRTWNNYLAAEREFLSVANSVVDLIIRARPTLHADGTTLLFEDDEDVERYNGLVDVLDRVVAAEEAALTALQELSLRQIQRADSLLSALGR